MLLFNPLFVPTGKSFSVFIIFSIFKFIFFGTAKSAIPAISISLNKIKFWTIPFATYESTIFPSTNPQITPIFPNLFNIPAIIPEIAYAATTIGSLFAIIPSVTPIVAPAVVPVNIPFFQPKTNTINIDNTFLIENPSTFKSPKLHRAIDNSKLVPNTSSIENAIFSL